VTISAIAGQHGERAQERSLRGAGSAWSMDGWIEQGPR
jgi:hypothetical protein